MKNIIRLNEKELCRLINESVKMVLNESTDEGAVKNLAMAGLMGLGVAGGMNNAQAQQQNTYPDGDTITTTQPTNKSQIRKYTDKELAKMFPKAYADRNANAKVWFQNKSYYTGEINGKISLVGEIAASDGRNPWEALRQRYSSEITCDFKLSDFNFD